jgi:hypothetical protein
MRQQPRHATTCCLRLRRHHLADAAFGPQADLQGVGVKPAVLGLLGVEARVGYPR